jgi:SsrA-binding protein
MSKVSIRNKKANFEFEIIDKYVAGIQLTGTEIKSLRESKASIGEAYVYLHENEVFVKNMYIGLYENASYNNHEERRVRKLLLNRSEIDKLEKKLKVQGHTIIPLHLFINSNGLAKIEISLARGKKLYDKREDLKNKDAKRSMERYLKK